MYKIFKYERSIRGEDKMTEEITNRIRLSEYPRAQVLLQFIEGLFRKNTELFQFAFGTILFSNAIQIMFKSDQGFTNELKFNLWILGIFFLLYVSFIYLKYTRDYLENKNTLFSQTLKQYDNFLSKYSDWIQEKAQIMSIDNYQEAIGFLQKAVGLFNVTSISQIDEKLSKVVYLMNDAIFHTDRPMKFKPRSPPSTPDLTTPTEDISLD